MLLPIRRGAGVDQHPADGIALALAQLVCIPIKPMGVMIVPRVRSMRPVRASL
jgi:hypothetical protein